MSRNANLFQSRRTALEFPEVLEKAQSFLSQKYSEMLSKNDEKNDEQLKTYIRQYLNEQGYTVENMTTDVLVDLLFREMAGFSFLTPYLNGKIKDVEGIEINSWDDVKVKFAGGTVKPAEGRFFSPEHARSVFTRLLDRSHITMDGQKPLVRGHLGKKIRVTVIGGYGVLDDDVGIAASVRFVNPSKLEKGDLIRFGTAMPEMLDLLIVAFRCGQSVMIAGETDSGKTTLISIIMEEAVPFDKKLYTIEYGTREFNQVKRDEKDNRVLNNVVHTVTRESDDPKLAITQQMLLEQGMTMNPDYICMAEVKGSEAFETIEAALTGHPVIGTTHAGSAEGIPDRLVQLASLKSSNLSDKTLYSMESKAFPLLVFAQKGPDNVRRITKICECIPVGGSPELHPLYEYVDEGNQEIDGEILVRGHFQKCEPVSDFMLRRLRQKGATDQELSKLQGGAA